MLVGSDLSQISVKQVLVLELHPIEIAPSGRLYSMACDCRGFPVFEDYISRKPDWPSPHFEGHPGHAT